MTAKISVERSDSAYELLQAPNSLMNQSVQACYPSRTQPFASHRDGSGIAWVEGGDIRIEKTSSHDCWSHSFQEMAHQLRSQFLIAHNRKASKGLEVDATQSHPYSGMVAGRTVAFCHNGAVRNFMEEASERGVSDSFIFLDHISLKLQKLDLSHLANLLKTCADTWSYSSINGFLLVDDGVYAWRCFNTDTSTYDIFDRYYTLFTKKLADKVLISSERLDESEGWEILSNRSLLAVNVENGEVKTEQIMF